MFKYRVNQKVTSPEGRVMEEMEFGGTATDIEDIVEDVVKTSLPNRIKWPDATFVWTIERRSHD
jgi:hypothetical protein